jgi:hypothetical protein
MKIFLIFILPFTVFAGVFKVGDIDFDSRSAGLRNSDFALISPNYPNSLINPAFTAGNPSMYFSSTYFNHFEDVNSGAVFFNYPDIFIKGHPAGFSISAINYGSFEDIDSGTEYNPYDLMLSVSQSYKWKDILTGINIHYAYSSISSEYNSSAVFTDIAALYKLMNGKITAGGGIFDLGLQTDPYYDSEEDIDPHFRAGIGYDLDKIPLSLCSQYDHYLSGFNRYAFGLELEAKKNLIVRTGYDFSGNDKEIGSNTKIEKFGGLSFGATILFDAFGFDFSYIINGELDSEFCATINLLTSEIFK